MSMRRIIEIINPSEAKQKEDEKAERSAIIAQAPAIPKVPTVKATPKEIKYKYEEPILTAEQKDLLNKKTVLQRLLQTLQEYFPEKKGSPSNYLIKYLERVKPLINPSDSEADLSPKISRVYSSVEIALEKSIIADKNYYLDVLRGKELPTSKEKIKSSLIGDFDDYAKAAKYEVKSAKDFDSIKNALSHFLQVAIRYQIDLDKTTKGSQSRVEETKSLRDSLKKLERCNSLDDLHVFLYDSMPSREPRRSTWEKLVSGAEKLVSRASLSGQRPSLVLTEFNQLILSALATVRNIKSPDLESNQHASIKPLSPKKG